VNGWFVVEFGDREPTEIVAYDADGDVLPGEFRWERLLEFRRSLPSAPVRRPGVQQSGPAREVARIEARGGTETVILEVAPATGGNVCRIVRSAQTRTNRACGLPAPGPDEIGLTGMQFGGGAPDGIQLLVGRVGSEIARLRLRYQDGRVVAVPLHEGWAMYEVVPADYAEGRRPAELVGLDAAGRKIASKRLPWA
jgi:hypothetical protein